MPIGTVLSFDPEKGYGFIEPDGDGDNLFVHITALVKAGIPKLRAGDRVSYHTVLGQYGKEMAGHLKLIDD